MKNDVISNTMSASSIMLKDYLSTVDRREMEGL